MHTCMCPQGMYKVKAEGLSTQIKHEGETNAMVGVMGPRSKISHFFGNQSFHQALLKLHKYSIYTI